jgi:membrane fusion protein (multidrug efflux system)
MARFRRFLWAAAAFSLVACGGGTSAPNVEFRIPVEVADVTTDKVEDLIVTTGTLRARERVILSVETPGFLVLGRDANGARLAEGSAVTKGQLVAQITGEDARLAARLEATAKLMENTKQEMTRRQQLYEQKLVSEESVWQSEAAYQDALHAYETSQRTLQKARMTTPISGIILELARDDDRRPMADGQMVLPGFQVAHVAPLDQLIADIDLVGPELAKVRPGLPVRIRHFAFEGVTLDGEVLRLSPTMDVASHTFRAEVSIDNSLGLLRPGMFIEASIIVTSRSDVAVVPRQAIAQRAGRNVVFVLDGQRAVQREVQLGLGDDDQVEVRDGLSAGERIVIHGLETLTDGTRVRVASSS